ncbi:expressed protein [Batrachochytrium dendrobatidis JAM81]|uniref:Expressed protein n=1 Tax=Batrachochytrium dendrobatidis (strain JAM81 / FGSC 10211) TaxID=684364 RepID=F4P811_BATDJ|nr:uncharacterized protein BATDEDRAFT_33524 [Batrachochytrium dendrobatidis JAM81]EGF78484.1 expressed protein [Batrachochytrium dendrobatidis JAM81]|eukprot:XP_006680770.1 expressed protein [Batrachochytrium dendrobatidis JAM81]
MLRFATFPQSVYYEPPIYRLVQQDDSDQDDSAFVSDYPIRYCRNCRAPSQTPGLQPIYITDGSAPAIRHQQPVRRPRKQRQQVFRSRPQSQRASISDSPLFQDLFETDRDVTDSARLDVWDLLHEILGDSTKQKHPQVRPDHKIKSKTEATPVSNLIRINIVDREPAGKSDTVEPVHVETTTQLDNVDSHLNSESAGDEHNETAASMEIDKEPDAETSLLQPDPSVDQPVDQPSDQLAQSPPSEWTSIDHLEPTLLSISQNKHPVQEAAQETDTAYIYRMQIPDGVTQGMLDVQVDEVSRLTHIKTPGEFSKSIQLPDNADLSSLSATIGSSDNILEIVLDKMSA